MKKALALVTATLLAVLLLASCNTPLPGDLNADDLKAATRAAGDAIVARDYDAFIALFDADTQEEYGATMAAEDLAAFYNPMLDGLGEYKEISGLEVGPYKDANGNEYGIVLIDQKFANGTLSHTATFNLDGELIGFGIRNA